MILPCVVWCWLYRDKVESGNMQAGLFRPGLLLSTSPSICASLMQVNWGVDLTEGKAQDPWKNALLSNDAKETMWRMHSQEG